MINWILSQNSMSILYGQSLACFSEKLGNNMSNKIDKQSTFLKVIKKILYKVLGKKCRRSTKSMLNNKDQNFLFKD